ncbi:hypothetical protein OEZ85_002977 [Tetradesmus obliquus]|uniref:Uncharacterized protein n=1 Tax=Tetradesmus obliquus TaxID=3088 RepID=A0ABY8TZ79_TETOB|nr:hypothetical protein OEZ85_002977 [Tetradesmus obliquus]
MLTPVKDPACFCRQLTPQQVEGLLSLLRPQPEAAGFQRIQLAGWGTLMHWLASQPGAAAAAAHLGLTARDVRGDAAAALLFGSSQEAGAALLAGGM